MRGRFGRRTTRGRGKDPEWHYLKPSRVGAFFLACEDAHGGGVLVVVVFFSPDMGEADPRPSELRRVSNYVAPLRRLNRRDFIQCIVFLRYAKKDRMAEGMKNETRSGS